MAALSLLSRARVIDKGKKGELIYSMTITESPDERSPREELEESFDFFYVSSSSR